MAHQRSPVDGIENQKADLFRARLDEMIDMSHPLVRVGQVMPWEALISEQAVEPTLGHLKTEHRMRRCFLKGQLGDALNAVLAAAGYNLRWLMRWLLLFCAWILGTLRAERGLSQPETALLPV